MKMTVLKTQQKTQKGHKNYSAQHSNPDYLDFIYSHVSTESSDSAQNQSEEHLFRVKISLVVSSTF